MFGTIPEVRTFIETVESGKPSLIETIEDAAKCEDYKGVFHNWEFKEAPEAASATEPFVDLTRSPAKPSKSQQLMNKSNVSSASGMLGGNSAFKFKTNSFIMPGSSNINNAGSGLKRQHTNREEETPSTSGILGGNSSFKLKSNFNSLAGSSNHNNAGNNGLMRDLTNRETETRQPKEAKKLNSLQNLIVTDCDRKNDMFPFGPAQLG